jgi:hypothetical protein
VRVEHPLPGISDIVSLAGHLDPSGAVLGGRSRRRRFRGNVVIFT